MNDTKDEILDSTLRNNMGVCVYVWTGRFIPLDSVVDATYLSRHEIEENT